MNDGIMTGEASPGSALLVPPAYVGNQGFGITIDGFYFPYEPASLSVTPDKGYVVQDTGTGRVRVQWPGLTRTGMVDMTIDLLTDEQAAELIAVCASRVRDRALSFAGRLYSTDRFEVTQEPDEVGWRHKVHLSFHARLPGISPPPGFGGELRVLVRFTELGSAIADAWELGDAIAVRTDAGALWTIGLNGELTQVVGYGLTADTSVLPRDAETSWLLDKSGSSWSLATVRGTRVSSAGTILPPTGTVDSRMTPQGLEVLTKTYTTSTTFNLSVVNPYSGSIGSPDWARYGTRTALTADGEAHASLMPGGLLARVNSSGGDLVDPLAPRCILVSDPSLTIPLAAEAGVSAIALAPSNAGVLSSVYLAREVSGHLVSVARERQHTTSDTGATVRTGFFGYDDRPVPWAITPAALNVLQEKHASVWRYPAVIAAFARSGIHHLVTRRGVYRTA